MSLSDDQLDAINQRDQGAADGIVVADNLVWQDRHDLLVEVRRLRALVGDRAEETGDG